MAEKYFSPERLLEAMGGMSNIDLAEKLGCARSNITMYLSGQRTPAKTTIQLIAICLGVNPAWLMGLDAPKYLEKPTPVSESGPSDPVVARIMDIVLQLSPETQARCLEYFESLLALQKAAQAPNTQN